MLLMNAWRGVEHNRPKRARDFTVESYSFEVGCARGKRRAVGLFWNCWRRVLTCSGAFPHSLACVLAALAFAFVASVGVSSGRFTTEEEL
ncbi:MAG: hypothetical protein RI897_2361 [Verrucomicrobiota bacterium]